MSISIDWEFVSLHLLPPLCSFLEKEINQHIQALSESFSQVSEKNMLAVTPNFSTVWVKVKRFELKGNEKSAERGHAKTIVSLLASPSLSDFADPSEDPGNTTGSFVCILDVCEPDEFFLDDLSTSDEIPLWENEDYHVALKKAGCFKNSAELNQKPPKSNVPPSSGTKFKDTKAIGLHFPTLSKISTALRQFSFPSRTDQSIHVAQNTSLPFSVLDMQIELLCKFEIECEITSAGEIAVDVPGFNISSLVALPISLSLKKITITLPLKIAIIGLEDCIASNLGKEVYIFITTSTSSGSFAISMDLETMFYSMQDACPSLKSSDKVGKFVEALICRIIQENIAWPSFIRLKLKNANELLFEHVKGVIRWTSEGNVLPSWVIYDECSKSWMELANQHHVSPDALKSCVQILTSKLVWHKNKMAEKLVIHGDKFAQKRAWVESIISKPPASPATLFENVVSLSSKPALPVTEPEAFTTQPLISLKNYARKSMNENAIYRSDIKLTPKNDDSRNAIMANAIEPTEQSARKPLVQQEHLPVTLDIVPMEYYSTEYLFVPSIDEPPEHMLCPEMCLLCLNVKDIKAPLPCGDRLCQRCLSSIQMQPMQMCPICFTSLRSFFSELVNAHQETPNCTANIDILTVSAASKATSHLTDKTLVRRSSKSTS